MIKYLTIIVTLIVCSILSEIYFALPSHAFNSLRFHTQRGGGEQCLKNLKTFSSDFKALGTFTENKCIVKNAVKVSSYKNTKLSGNLTLSCPMALKLGEFLNEINAKGISHLGSYNCRKIAGFNIFSEHSYGMAIDISEIDNATLSNDWGKKTQKGEVLKGAYEAACNYFSNVLTPDSNHAHNNHFHFDMGYGMGCYFN